MKKLLFVLCAAAGISAAAAQDNVLQFLPNEEGTQLVSNCYDANNTLQGTMTMTIVKNYEYYDGQDLDIAYTMTDASGNVMNEGKIDARYTDGDFWIDMKSQALSPTIGQYVSVMSELTGDFLDYPNQFPDPLQMQDEFQMDGGSFTINAPDSKHPVASVRKYGRQIEGSEKITTPAGTFDATKITFTVEVEQDGNSTTYRGVEWYSAGSGVVRSEIYDHQRNLLDYTELASITKPRR